MLARQLAVALRAAGYEVETARTASEGLLAAEKCRPDLGLVDPGSLPKTRQQKL